uniref:Uncharacterized protein n=1 Tax=Rhizophora mucronata TaxID=61149 RepID=A0A2P2NCY4_RHIMU
MTSISDPIIEAGNYLQSNFFQISS